MQQGRCPPGWFHLKNNCVFLNPIPSTFDNSHYGVNRWKTAFKRCNEKGADLMMVRDLKDLNGLLSIYNALGDFYRRNIFLGSRENFNLRWKWVNGDVVDPALWGTGEPNSKYGRCGAIENFEKKWFNRGCGWWLAAKRCKFLRKAYICETGTGEFVRFHWTITDFNGIAVWRVAMFT